MTFRTAERVALSREIDAASSLLRHGFEILGGYRFASSDADPLFACLAGGTEKLLKLTFGLMTVDDGSYWPSKATMQGAGHKIVELDTTVRGLLVERQGRSSAPGLIAQLLDMTDRHPGVVQVLLTLERYAVNGRFFNLDLLGGRTQPNPAPEDLWAELERDIVEANPGMLDQVAARQHERFRQDMNGIIARSLGLWCELLARSWVTGVCGELAQECAPQLELGHPTPRVRP
jgi:hypothetical protein